MPSKRLSFPLGKPPTLTPPLGYATELANAREIGAYIERMSSTWVDEQMVEEHFAHCRASLVLLDVASLTEGSEDGNLPSRKKQSAYAKLPADTMPPLVVENGEISDGNHRFRVAVARGQEKIWCYQVEEIE